MNQTCFTIFCNEIAIFALQILIAMKRVITKESFFDLNNPTVIIGENSFEDALDMKALHVTEIRLVKVKIGFFRAVL